jgi:hypothetical protein
MPRRDSRKIVLGLVGGAEFEEFGAQPQAVLHRVRAFQLRAQLAQVLLRVQPLGQPACRAARARVVLQIRQDLGDQVGGHADAGTKITIQAHQYGRPLRTMCTTQAICRTISRPYRKGIAIHRVMTDGEGSPIVDAG